MKRTLFPILLLGLLLGATVTGVSICKVPEEVAVGHGIASSVALSVLAVLAWVLLDRLVPWRIARAALAGLAFLGGVVAIVDVVVLSITRMHAAEAVRVLRMGGGFWHAINEIGASRFHVFLVVALMGLLFALGSWLYHRLEPPRCSLRGGVLLGTAALLIAGAFLLEQKLTHSRMEYRFRPDYLPCYPQIFDEGIEHFVLLPAYPDDAHRLEHLERIGKARNPKHVLFIVLESFRADTLRADYTPNLCRLKAEGTSFSRCITEAIYTPAVFNPLLMNRFAATAGADCYFFERNQTGALPLELAKRAGYRVHLAFPSDLSFGNYTRRILGTRGVVDELFLPFDEKKGLTADILDNRVTDKVVEWMDGFDPSRPSFVLLQYNATHWDYYFDESRPLIGEDPEWMSRQIALRGKRLAKFYRRYLNAAHHVDGNIGRLLRALEKRKLLEHTAVVAVSDHGECFSSGYYGHSAFREEVLAIPMILRLPGLRPKRHERITSTSAAMATLLDYLEIEGLEPWMLVGRSMLPAELPPEAALTANGDQSRFLLTLPQGRIELSAGLASVLLKLRVKNAWDASGRPVENLSAFLDTLPWRQRLNALLMRDRRPL